MALFRRNRVEEVTTLPEMDPAYDVVAPERSWMAWVMALVTLVVTVAIVIGLFYGGRWVYRKLHKSNKPTTSQNTPATATVETNDESANSTSTSSDTSNSSSNSSTSSTSSNSSSTNSASGTNQTGSSSSPSSNSSNSSSTSTTAAGKGATSGNLTNTGPGDMVSVFAAVSLLGYLIHRRLVKNS